VGKLFEKIILNKIKQWITVKQINFPSSNQNAYQESLCSVLASFEVQENMYHNNERKSKTYLGLLDSSSAFDTGWHNGLFVKLYKMGIKGKLWQLLYEAYQGMESHVVLNGLVSDVIPVRQSVRQGSILGPWLYMFYVHDLAVALQASNCGCRVGQVPCGGILQADDIVIMALTPNALQELLHLCESYSLKWRYRYNPVKSKVMVFGESSIVKSRLQKKRMFMLYGEEIEQVSECVHVGITLDSHHNHAQRTANAVSKMRGALMSIVGSGVRPTGLSCVTAIKVIQNNCFAS
jgi:hypothetical protein